MMKKFKTTTFSVIIVVAAFFNGCKKTSIPDPTVTIGGSINSANFVTEDNNTFMFFDLNHDDNKHKKYFYAERMFLTKDTMKIKDGPYPINNLTTNWPSEVKDIGMGSSSYMFVSAYMGLRITSGNSQYDSIRILSGYLPGTLNPFEDPHYSHSMAGKTPQGYTMIQVPDGVGGSTPIYPIFYFKEGYYIDRPFSWATYNPAPINTLLPGGTAARYDWANVDNVTSYVNDLSGNFRTHLFFDFKNWRYFTWEEGCTMGCSQRTLTLGAYQSLDNLLKWPAGWGKK